MKTLKQYYIGGICFRKINMGSFNIFDRYDEHIQRYDSYVQATNTLGEYKNSLFSFELKEVTYDSDKLPDEFWDNEKVILFSSKKVMSDICSALYDKKINTVERTAIWYKNTVEKMRKILSMSFETKGGDIIGLEQAHKLYCEGKELYPVVMEFLKNTDIDTVSLKKVLGVENTSIACRMDLENLFTKHEIIPSYFKYGIGYNKYETFYDECIALTQGAKFLKDNGYRIPFDTTVSYSEEPLRKRLKLAEYVLTVYSEENFPAVFEYFNSRTLSDEMKFIKYIMGLSLEDLQEVNMSVFNNIRYTDITKSLILQEIVNNGYGIEKTPHIILLSRNCEVVDKYEFAVGMLEDSMKFSSTKRYEA